MCNDLKRFSLANSHQKLTFIKNNYKIYHFFHLGHAENQLISRKIILMIISEFKHDKLFAMSFNAARRYRWRNNHEKLEKGLFSSLESSVNYIFDVRLGVISCRHTPSINYIGLNRNELIVIVFLNLIMINLFTYLIYYLNT